MVKPGYKQTEIGVIPEDWEIVTLREIAIGKFSYGINAPAVEYMPPLPNYIRITDISDDGRFLRETRASVVCKNPEQFTLKENDIVFARTGASTGKTYLYRKEDGELVYAGFLIKASIDPTCADSRYVFSTLHTRAYWDWVSTSSMRSGQPGINGNEYASYRIALPELREQSNIATILEDIDQLIIAIEKLVAKKQSIKQGTMQELLTGKKRLPGFDGRWISGKWKDVLEGFSSGATPYRGNSSFYNGTIKWVSSGELNYNRIFDTIEHISQNAQIKTNLSMHPAGTFLMAITGLEAAGTRGSCAILGSPATTNQSCMAIYGTERMSTEYLFHYYVHHGDELAFQYCQGTKQQSYTAAIVKELPIYYPEDVREQNAIASLLTDMDNEIEELKQKLDKYRSVKQGMMQQLLTGKIRLV